MTYKKRTKHSIIAKQEIKMIEQAKLRLRIALRKLEEK